MRMRAVVRRISHFPKVLGQMMGAAGSLVQRFANDHVVPEAKNFVAQNNAGSPDSTGRLERSVHSATEDYTGEWDYEAAETSDLENAQLEIEDFVTNTKGTFVLVAGSWLPYACVEETGRRKQYITPAVETLQGVTADSMAMIAFKEAGL